MLPNPLIGVSGPEGAGAKSTERQLIDGEFVQVLVQGVMPIEVLGVPRASILSDQQGDYVYTVDAQNHAQQTRVQLGQSTASVAAVTSGLTEGETVISEGIQKVRPGIVVVPGPASVAPKVARTQRQVRDSRSKSCLVLFKKELLAFLPS